MIREIGCRENKMGLVGIPLDSAGEHVPRRCSWHLEHFAAVPRPQSLELS